MDVDYLVNIPAGREFTGFYLAGALSGCQVTRMDVINRSTCVILDLSQVAGASQNVFTDVTRTKSFTATPLDCGSTAIEYQVTYTPSSATPNLIRLSTSTPSTIECTQATNTADA